MTRYDFEQIGCTATRSGICPVCGKRGKRSRTITNTVNPFNRNADGSTRTRDEVAERVTGLAAEWAATPFVHEKCEDSNA